MLSLTLLDFQKALPFSTKIEDGQLRPFIDQALLLDIVPVLGWPVLEAVQALPEATLQGYAPDLVVAAGDYVLRRERVYRALVAAPLLPPPIGPDPAGTDSSGQWAYEPLLTLWSQYLKPYWVQAAFDRFAPQHGLNFTKAGITVPTDGREGTYTQPSAAARAALQASLSTTTEALRTRLLAFRQVEQAAYGRSTAVGYDYGLTQQPCGSQLPARAGRLRGINSTRPFANAHPDTYPR